MSGFRWFDLSLGFLSARVVCCFVDYLLLYGFCIGSIFSGVFVVGLSMCFWEFGFGVRPVSVLITCRVVASYLSMVVIA